MSSRSLDPQVGPGWLPERRRALYFDAASLLIKRLQQVSKIVGGNLVIDRAALAQAVRNTTGYQGVTCTISLEGATGNRINDPAALDRCEQG